MNIEDIRQSQYIENLSPREVAKVLYKISCSQVSPKLGNNCRRDV